MIACAGVRSDGSSCPTPANEVTHVDGADVPTCEFHDGLYLETGSLRPISRRTRRRRDREQRERGGNGAATGTVRERVVATAHDVYERMEDVLIRSMAATKVVSFACKSCGVKNRIEVPDYTNALRSVELMLAKSAATPKDDDSTAYDEAALMQKSVAEMSTKELYRALTGGRPGTVASWGAEDSAAKVELVLDVADRIRRDPDSVSEDEQRDAYRALDGIRQLERAFEPLRGITLAEPATLRP